MNEFNQYLAFDGWKISRVNKEIVIRKNDLFEFQETTIEENTEDKFLQYEFKDVSVQNIRLDPVLN